MLRDWRNMIDSFVVSISFIVSGDYAPYLRPIHRLHNLKTQVPVEQKISGPRFLKHHERFDQADVRKGR
jgi:hypothetical protein